MHDDLAAIGLDSWRVLDGLLREKTAETAHGKLPEWRAILERLPACEPTAMRLDGPAVSVGPELTGEERATARELLLRLLPWRKGPFTIGGVQIDSEWRSDWKWERVASAISPLDGRAVLDVGCGNGYYALRMRGAGARAVIGIDPTLLYVVQFRAIAHWMRPEPVHVLPLRLHELPPEARAFDTVFSMGVLYHQRSPEAHLRQLRNALRPGGELVLETLILPGTGPAALAIEGRYARMRNVWLLPTLALLESWLCDAGFTSVRTADVSETTTAEQRRTEWMPFESLAEALDPADSARTIEGWPAPRRALLVALD
ncbi:MAG TPA: tRNA 5-methoxyuridine(34)/uridine 5-oxyacetic acid(34) synthase CmoB [Woeseiaceae bacterium]|nr:tRNA 5-methoxyuridine(34)/uridine 5-oxyacetic acid(34) synthase CmoB [Woeseiaceae bacterium]